MSAASSDNSIMPTTTQTVGNAFRCHHSSPLRLNNCPCWHLEWAFTGIGRLLFLLVIDVGFCVMRRGHSASSDSTGSACIPGFQTSWINRETRCPAGQRPRPLMRSKEQKLLPDHMRKVPAAAAEDGPLHPIGNDRYSLRTKLL